VKKIELDAETRRTTIKRLKLQQFETRKNEEFVALGHEIVRYEKDLDAFETLELEAMDEVDGFRKAQQAAEAALAHTRKLVEEDLAAIAQRHARTEAERLEVIAERERLATNVPESIMPLYLRLMKTKDGRAVAPMRDGKCEGCHMKLIASTVVKAQSGREIAQCEDCGRILYVEE
jgi:predicted  nucleic acid-binding Zn-ribbon protein